MDTVTLTVVDLNCTIRQPEANLNCNDLIQAYEKKLSKLNKAKKTESKSKKHSVDHDSDDDDTSTKVKVKDEPTDDEDDEHKAAKKVKTSIKTEDGVKRSSKDDGKKSKKESSAKSGHKTDKDKAKDGSKKDKDKKPSGIDLGWTVVKCEGSKLDDDGQLFFKIKFREGEKSQLIPADVANRKCVQALTTYFTDRANYYERLNKDKRAGLGLKPKVFKKKEE